MQDFQVKYDPQSCLSVALPIKTILFTDKLEKSIDEIDIHSNTYF